MRLKHNKQDDNRSKNVCAGAEKNLLAHLSRWEGPPHSRLRLWSLRWWSRRGPAELNRSQEDTAGCRACSLQLPLTTQKTEGGSVNIFLVKESVKPAIRQLQLRVHGFDKRLHIKATSEIFKGKYIVVHLKTKWIQLRICNFLVLLFLFFFN